MLLKQVLETEQAEYNHFVANSPSGSFLQSWEWGQWQAALGRKIVRYWILDEILGQMASIQLIKMPLPFGRHYLYAPYGPVTDLRFKVEDLRFLVQGLQTKFADAVFIRIEPKDKEFVTSNPQLATKSANIQPSKTLFLDLTKSNEQLLVEMHYKTRYNIKLAQKHRVEIKGEFDLNVGHGLFFEEAVKLIQETSKRQKFTTFAQGYYRNMADFFALHNQGAVKLRIYKAIFQNQLLAAAFMVDFGEVRTFLFGGSSEFHKNVMAPYLLHWQAIVDAGAEGLKLYDFWGVETASGATPGFVRFKLGFGGEPRDYAGAYDIIQNKTFYASYSALRAINRVIKKISR